MATAKELCSGAAAAASDPITADAAAAAADTCARAICDRDHSGLGWVYHQPLPIDFFTRVRLGS